MAFHSLHRVRENAAHPRCTVSDPRWKNLCADRTQRSAARHVLYLAVVGGSDSARASCAHLIILQAAIDHRRRCGDTSIQGHAVVRARMTQTTSAAHADIGSAGLRPQALPRRAVDRVRIGTTCKIANSPPVFCSWSLVCRTGRDEGRCVEARAELRRRQLSLTREAEL